MQEVLPAHFFPFFSFSFLVVRVVQTKESDHAWFISGDTDAPSRPTYKNPARAITSLAVMSSPNLRKCLACKFKFVGGPRHLYPQGSYPTPARCSVFLPKKK
jgi:hypothetical protein